MNFIWAFIVGGAFCVAAQLLIDLTDMTPAHVLVSYVVAGVLLEGLGVYHKIKEFAGCGATVPLTGFGSLLAKGAREGVQKDGLLGAFTGGLSKASAGIGIALGFALLLSLFFKSKEK